MASKRMDNEFMQNQDNVIQKPLEEVMHESIIPYAEYVIMDRALPRVEDGLKPVQRRILYTMYELGLTPDKPHRKSARIVGDTLGKYHPHGDASVYEAMVRMAQDFNMRALLVDGYGNFGSIDGDTAAAMRYTEARLTPLAMEMLRDIDKDTVKFSLNFDDTLKEPDMLPGRFPNVLVNGASGIAVGMATNIPPHNLGEAIDAVIAQMENPDISLDELLKIMPGPDFPTGGIIIGQDEIKKAYETGHGRIFLRARVEVEDAPGGKKLLVIKELPYQVNKAALLEKILNLSEEKKGVLTGIADIRDESDRQGIRAVIELKKDAAPEKILNYLYKYSDLQVSFGINMVVIADGKPQQLGLKAIIDYYIRHQKDVVTRRTRYELDKAKARQHILEGLMVAIQNIDEVIAIIRSSENPGKAKQRLMDKFNLTDVQAQAILDMRLQKLTGLEISNLKKEYEDLTRQIRRLENILSSEQALINVIKQELLEIKEKYADPRRTKIIEDVKEAEISVEDLIYVEDAVITLSHNQYIKRVPAKSYSRSSRDVESVETGDGDYIEFVVESATDHKVLIFTDVGNCYTLACNDIPEGKWRDRGVPLYTLVNSLEGGERPVAVLSVKEFAEDQYIQFYTAMGMIKRTPLIEYNAKKTKIQACGLNEGDKVVAVELTRGDRDVMLITREGMSIRFHGDEVPSVGRTAKGVKAIRLKEDDEVIFASEVDDEGEIVVVTDRGFVKRTLLVDYQPQGRGGVGFRTIRFAKNKSNGRYLVAAFYVKEPYEIILQQKDGTVTRVSTESIAITERDGAGEAALLVLMDNEVCAAYRNYKD
ncbi:DNA gyrase subunit A [Caldicoprobacter faecalis]|uniref:DNA topoisomerase (ATP-hydrolyzing) n=1 Tax=Caldicoprobacter faecalis TaxID=937334 RepID=A0A1I5YCY1_9FIRM|nr:DNA gyrase subunit A [Caldicoprobacter faecalis]SFQ42094.1 DNA topoisomerase IV subunit A [Caldicoprobacter faecalis]